VSVQRHTRSMRRILQRAQTNTIMDASHISETQHMSTERREEECINSNIEERKKERKKE
jgi:hypothetical protein